MRSYSSSRYIFPVKAASSVLFMSLPFSGGVEQPGHGAALSPCFPAQARAIASS